MFARLSLLGAALSLVFTGCGKGANEDPPTVLEFPHTLPLMAVELERNIAPAWTSGRGLAVDVDAVYVVDRDNGDLVRLDRKDLSVLASVPVGDRPEQVVMTPDGALLVTVRGSGEVVRLGADMTVESRTQVGSEAYGVALAVDGRSAYVTLPLSGELVALDAATLEELDRVETLALPRGVAVSPQGWVVVAHQASDAIQYPLDLDGMLRADLATPIRLRTGNPSDLIEGLRLPNLKASRALAAAIEPSSGAALLAHVQAAPGTSEAFVNAQLARQGLGADEVSESNGYGTEAPPGVTFEVPTRPIEIAITATDPAGNTQPGEADLPVQDTVTGEPITHLVDQPSDINHHPSWSLAFVTGYGTDNVLVVNTSLSDPMRSPMAIIDVGRAPRAVAFSPDGAFAYVLNDHDLSVSEIDLAALITTAPQHDAGDNTVEAMRLSATRTQAFGIDPMTPEMRRGARVFTFSRNDNISHAGQFACASCHFEGGEDKMVWFITDGPRQTPALAGRLLGTAPFNWIGSEAELKSNMAKTVRRMGGEGLSNQELNDLENFLLHGLQPPANPNLADSGLTELQREGKAIFESDEAQCVSCHRSGPLTDGAFHDVGTASPEEVMVWEIAHDMGLDARPSPGTLNTPTLRGLHYTAPYLHDGSAATLYDVLERTADTMGKTSHLTPHQRDALVAYLLTL